MTDLCPHMLPPENCVYCRRPDAPPPKSAETMSPERRLRAGIKLAHHHALWLGVVDYRTDPLDQKLVDHVLAQVRQRVDDYFAATKELLVPPPKSAEPASGKVEPAAEEVHCDVCGWRGEKPDWVCKSPLCPLLPAPPSDKVLVSREALERVVNTFGEMLFKGDFTQDEARHFGQPLAALRSEMEGGE